MLMQTFFSSRFLFIPFALFCVNVKLVKVPKVIAVFGVNWNVSQDKRFGQITNMLMTEFVLQLKVFFVNQLKWELKYEKF